MKEFKDLEFAPHSNGIGEQARLTFDNGYGVSVLFGGLYYSNGIDTYELAIFKDGCLCYDTYITDDVIGRISKEEITKVMKQVQEL